MDTTVAERGAAGHQTVTALQRQVQSAMPGLTSRIAPCIDRPQLRLANSGCVWMLSPLSCDPLTGPGGQYVLPPCAVADLSRIAATGIEFHLMVVGHEIDLRGPARQLIPQLRDGPRSCPPDLARALVGPVPADPRAAQLAQSLGRAVTAVTGAVTALASGTARHLDPVIFGLIGAGGQPEPGAPALWVACTKWEW